MAPTISSAMTYPKEHLTLTHKLRKPLVEKLRRERINSSIEQIKSLLGPETFNQQPDSKLEKHDILEMTVSFLRRLKQQQQYQPTSSSSYSPAANNGYSMCVQELVHFLSKDDEKTQSQRRLLSHFKILQSSSVENSMERDLVQPSSPSQFSDAKEKSRFNSTLWRTW
ncbi:transcription factor HES-5-like [Aplochiton taeniatus]